MRNNSSKLGKSLGNSKQRERRTNPRCTSEIHIVGRRCRGRAPFGYICKNVRFRTGINRHEISVSRSAGGTRPRSVGGGARHSLEDFLVRKKARFAHIMMFFRHDVRRKRFNTHGTTKPIKFHSNKTGKQIAENHSPTLSFMRFQPRTGRMKERRQAESQKMAAGVKS